MWVSRKTWLELLDRVEKLENASFQRIPDPDNHDYFFGVPRTHYEQLPISDAVSMLTQHLGLQFSYKNQKSCFSLNKKPK